MAVTAGVATKAGLGLGILGAGATTVYFGGDYINNSLSKYEKELINFLEGGTDRDIVFEVKKDGNADLTTGDIAFTTETQKVSVSAKVQLSSASSTAFKKSGADATTGTDEIKKLNGGNWIWQCKLTFTKATGTDGSTNTIQASYKDKIFKGTDQGLLGILKKDFSNVTSATDGTPTRSEAIQTKIDFISRCGYERGVSKNREINVKDTLTSTDSSNELEISVKEFSFKKKESESDLIPEDTDHFARWFK